VQLIERGSSPAGAAAAYRASRATATSCGAATKQRVGGVSTMARNARPASRAGSVRSKRRRSLRCVSSCSRDLRCSRGSSIGPPRRSAGSYAARAARDCQGPIVSLGSATSASGQVSCRTSMSSSSVVSGRPASPSAKTASVVAARRAGAICTSRSTTTPASPTPRRARPQLCRLSAARVRLVRRAWRHDRTRAYGQREGLPRHLLDCGLRRAGDRSALHQALKPLDNGKAVAFIQTMLREWAYRYSYPTSPTGVDPLLLTP
jgi:hypothetical protein